ncbi:MAG TPA: aldehyde dehydrogenase family protein [Solirubrobacteraceae bacterium]|jgi:1-pyrroline-5-carboxylate dehydrogenase|nr:aldehyde dehydrogenase family protein [Solirubrobacteraceae bacterium]
MATRLTYTSGDIDSATHAEFERRLRDARAATGEMEPWPHIVGGRHLRDGPVFARADPSRIEQLASRAHTAEAHTVARAVAAAATARAEWRRTPFRERLEQLAVAARALAERQLEIAAVMSLETGKSRMEAIGEVREAVELIETYSEEMERHDGFVQPLASFTPGERGTELLRPYGVFGVIAPFNFPLALTAGMASAALLAGNTVVVKPSEETPWTGALLAEALLAGELPAGVFNLVHGGPATGRALVASAVDGLAFTGSAEVGREIARRMQEGSYARPALTEMGGKNPAIVTAAADLDAAAEGIARAAFGLSGQKCSACSRAIVLDAVHDELLARLCAFAATLPVGDPSERDTFLGPLVNAGALRRFEESVARARRDGRVALGGGRPREEGWYVEPTVVAGLPLGHPLTREELFLPFLTVTRVATPEEAIAEANAADYGLTAGIFSDDPDEVERFLDELQAGVLYVNRRAGATTGAWPRAQSFCGWKASGHTGKGGLGPYYLPQFMREQSRTVVER